jgi:alkanesulfonate monooxygenase SsuD/methylene tetrahydromethanopterin reductase-like flavin-dependent oxidoreductase (luciferase family)
VHFGVTLPNIGEGADARLLATVAREAEDAGWDGVFVWDALCVDTGDPASLPASDPWIALTAMAMTTERVRLGPIVTPISRRRPWKLARETATLDRLSGGRLTLPVGLGAATDDGGFFKVGEALDRRVRAKRLDEGLAILDGLWGGEPFHFEGEEFNLQEMTFLPRPLQSPRIPIWVVAAWPSPRSMRRALRWDGVMPIKRNADGSQVEMTPADLAEMRAYIAARRDSGVPYDIVVEASTPDDDPEAAVAKVRPYADAGVTWWLEAVWSAPDGFSGLRRRVEQGPPTLARERAG